MKTFLILAVILFMAANLFPQRSIIIHKNDGSGNETILASTIDSITFIKISGSSCVGIPTVAYAGKVYNTVQIGTQCWLKENLDVGTQVNGSAIQTNNGTIEKYCYNDDPANCTTYGGLYEWAEAVAYTNGAADLTLANPPLTGNVQGICPTGWHIPTNAEYQTLATAVSNNSNALKAVGQGTGAGSGTNTSGFSALLAGYCKYGGTFLSLGGHAFFWSSTEQDAASADYMELIFDKSNINFISYGKGHGFSVRCTKD